MYTPRRPSHANASLTSRILSHETLVSRHDALCASSTAACLCLRPLRALALHARVALAPDLVELQACKADVLRLAVAMACHLAHSENAPPAIQKH